MTINSPIITLTMVNGFVARAKRTMEEGQHRLIQTVLTDKTAIHLPIFYLAVMQSFDPLNFRFYNMSGAREYLEDRIQSQESEARFVKKLKGNVMLEPVLSLPSDEIIDGALRVLKRLRMGHMIIPSYRATNHVLVDYSKMYEDFTAMQAQKQTDADRVEWLMEERKRK